METKAAAQVPMEHCAHHLYGIHTDFYERPGNLQHSKSCQHQDFCPAHCKDLQAKQVTSQSCMLHVGWSLPYCALFPVMYLRLQAMLWIKQLFWPRTRRQGMQPHFSSHGNHMKSSTGNFPQYSHSPSYRLIPRKAWPKKICRAVCHKSRVSLTFAKGLSLL